ncbi:MAG TPA: C-GCAxxG-C-C family protein, partial [Bacillota bacterium]|nr:C-GCAxxG-C-C family protein [Bacillota bacterium]
MDLDMLLLEMSRQGFMCAQIMMKLALDIDGKENPDLIRAMSGLNFGMGKTGSACGALTGGAAALGYFTGQGEPEELPHSRASEIIAAYVNWFKDTYHTDTCHGLIGGDYAACHTVCPGIIMAGYG